MTEGKTDEAAPDEDAASPAGKDSPHLEEHEQLQAANAQMLAARVIHEVLREEGEVELRRPVGALVWSGLAAGMSMGFSFLTMALLKKSLAGVASADTIAPLGYSVGFVIAVLGKQQLFTETTLTATLPIMHGPTAAGIGRLLRMWTAVLVTNLIGTVIFAWLISRAGFFDKDMSRTLMELGKGAFSDSFWLGLLRGMFSGWLIALVVWLLPAAKTAGLFVIIGLTYIVALAALPHAIAGSAEAAYVVLNGGADWNAYFVSFLAPTVLGNLLGGTAMAALLNHAPVAHDMAARKAEG